MHKSIRAQSSPALQSLAMSTPLEGEAIALDGVRIAYQTIGEGPPLLLCHAFATDRTMWNPQLAALSANHRLITFDQRGSGHSEHPVWQQGAPDPYTLDSFADDVAAVLDDLRIERTRLLGLSMGAATAMRFATRDPKRVERLVLASAMASRLPEKIIERAGKVLRVLNDQGLEASYRFYFGGPLFDGFDTDGELPELIAGPLALATVEGFKGCYRVTIDRPSMCDDLTRITAPTLVMVGERDVHYLEEADRLRDRIPNAEKVVVEGVGHGMSSQDPDLFNAHVLPFLTRNGV